MDKKTAMESLARKAHENGVFNGTWLYAENGQIISKGAFGFCDAEDKLPMQEDSIFEMASMGRLQDRYTIEGQRSVRDFQPEG